MFYFIKSPTGNFPEFDDVEGFKPIRAIENRFFMCSCQSVPVTEFAVPFPDHLADQMYMYDFPQGKKHRADLFQGRIAMGPPDEKGRMELMYTDEQLIQRRDLNKWISTNVFLPDAQRMGIFSDSDVAELQRKVAECQTDTDIEALMAESLYYNL